MPTFSTIEDARSYFSGDLFARNAGITLDELGEDSCLCSMPVTIQHRNANNAVMGGAIFTLADFAFAVAANQLHNVTVAQQVSVNFLSSTRGSCLFARACCKKSGRISSIFQVEVFDDLGCDVALFVFTGCKL